MMLDKSSSTLERTLSSLKAKTLYANPQALEGSGTGGVRSCLLPFAFSQE